MNMKTHLHSQLNVPALVRAHSRRRKLWALASVSAIAIITLYSQNTHAVVSGRALFNMGAWKGSFSQKDSFGHEVKETARLGLGLGLQFGMSFGNLIFAEYNLVWLSPQHQFTHRDARIGDANYHSLAGLNTGVMIPLIGLEPYIGIESGSYGLSLGEDYSFGGWAWKLGANWFFTQLAGGPADQGVGIKFEYRKHMANTDDRGSLPAGVSAQSNTFFLGLVAGAR